MNTTCQDSNPDIMDVLTEIPTASSHSPPTYLSADPAETVLNHYITSPVALLGVCGNLVCLFVWSAESRFNPTTLFMKVMAVSDTVLVVEFLLRQFVNLVTEVPLLFFSLYIYSRLVTVHITLALIVVRWIAVYRPFQIRTFLSKRRAIIGCVLMLCFSFLGGLPYVITAVYFSHARLIAYYVLHGTCMALPVLVLVCLNVSLVYKLVAHNKKLAVHKSAPGARSSRFYRLLLAVICLSVSTTVAYPVSLVSTLMYTPTNTRRCEDFCVSLAYAIGDLCEVFNSSVNVIFYLIFVSEFRELLLQRIYCCLCRKGRSSFDIALQTSYSRTDFPSQTHDIGTHKHADNQTSTHFEYHNDNRNTSKHAGNQNSTQFEYQNNDNDADIHTPQQKSIHFEDQNDDYDTNRHSAHRKSIHFEIQNDDCNTTKPADNLNSTDFQSQNDDCNTTKPADNLNSTDFQSQNDD